MKCPKQKKNSDIEEVVEKWDDKLYLPIILKEIDPKAYEFIETIVKREAKRGNFIMPFDLMVFSEKYNNEVVEKFKEKDNVKSGVDILYKGIYAIVDNIVKNNNIWRIKFLDVFEKGNESDYRLVSKRIKSEYAYKLFNEMNKI